jgi:hypothetical protein
MGITESQHEKIKRLVRDLGSADKNRRETAVALLTIMGHRAVRNLHESLKSRQPALRLHSARVLGQIGDPRSMEPLLARLADPHPDVRSLAARSLSRLDAPELVPRLIETFNKQPDPGSRQHTVTALLSKARKGDGEAKAFVRDRLLDRGENPDIRLRALEILRYLTKKESRSVTAALRKEGREDLLAEAAGLPATAGRTRGGMTRLVRDLLSSDYFTWRKAYQKIHPGMETLPDLLLAELADQGGDAALCQRIEDVLLKVGPGALDSIHGYLEKETGPEMLESLLNLLRGFSDKSSVPYLQRSLHKLGEMLESSRPDELTRARIHYLKAKTHNLLAALACNDEKDDLLDMLQLGEDFVSPLLIEAAGKIGDRPFLLPLLALYSRHLETDPAYAEAVKAAFLQIASRKRVRATHSVFKHLKGKDQQLLLKIFV